MKLLLIGAALFFIAVLLFLSCGKDEEEQSSDNQPPIAHAGSDITITLASCSAKASAALDGSRSTDPDNNITSYSWRKVSGPQGEIITKSGNATSYKANADNLSPGEYAFELSITDAMNLLSKDTMLISVKAPGAVEYNLDVTLNGSYGFIDNAEDCYYFNPCLYYDFTWLEATGTYLPIGDIKVNFSEQSDSAASKYATESHYYLGTPNSTAVINGTSTINLKKLIQQGGGSFSGTFTVRGGSAQQCTYIYQNLPPLTVTGSLDTLTKKTTLTIKGKAYF